MAIGVNQKSGGVGELWGEKREESRNSRKKSQKKRKEKVIRGRLAAYFWKPREITVSKKKIV